MMYIVAGFICVFLITLVVVICLKAADEDQLMKFHPPDDDDGITLKEDDPDGQYQR